MYTDKTFEYYKNRLIYEVGEAQDIRYNVIQYLCSFIGIDPDEMAAALLHEGRGVLFDDSSISAAQNAANRRRVCKLLTRIYRRA